MAQTVRDTVTRAMRMLNVIIAGVSPTSVEAATGVTAYNSMLHGWKGQGVDVGHIDQTLNDELVLAPEFFNAITALLAVEMSGEYGVPIPQAVGIAAANGWSALQARYIIFDPNQDMIVETGLRRLSANRRGWWYSGMFYP